MKKKEVRCLYSTRPLSAGHPDIEARELATKIGEGYGDSHDSSVYYETIDDVLAYMRRAVDMSSSPKRVAVVGCGPLPRSVKRLGELGWECVGIEPVSNFVSQARDYLGRPEAVLEGSAENLPLQDESQAFLIMQSVLEHVDSPSRALNEAYRVLAPGGVLYAQTTNRLNITNGEYTVRFFQWLPKLVRESYIHQHLHFDPALARYTSRPAVHWFSYADLCSLGRMAGFYCFYSRLDLMRSTDAIFQRSRLRKIALDRVRYNPWLRSIALTQRGGGTIFMLKRSP